MNRVGPLGRTTSTGAGFRLHGNTNNHHATVTSSHGAGVPCSGIEIGSFAKLNIAVGAIGPWKIGLNLLPNAEEILRYSSCRGFPDRLFDFPIKKTIAAKTRTEEDTP